MPDVFISHDTADRDLVFKLAQELEAAGISTWYYERDALPGVPHTSQTGDAIAAAQATLLVISVHSIRSYEVNTEVNWTYAEHKSFVPVLVGITWAQFALEKKPWQQLIGLSAGIEATPDNLPMVVSKIAKGLRQLEFAAASATEPPLTPSSSPGYGQVQSPPTAAAQPERKHNLPLQVTRFFGREHEVVQIIERLKENRLVTLTGSGGV
ncbi:MAG: toll/interleukin-1 receptor domain-containing protein, partial [Anaerolineales bacterium]